MSGGNYIFIVQVTRQLCVDILNEFADNGATVDLYTGEVSNTYSELNKKIRVHYLCRYNKSSAFRRIFTWTWFTMQVFLKLCFTKRNVELVFISTPPFTSFVGLFFKKLFHRRYHLIIWDLYPDALQTLSGVTKTSLAYRLWAKANKPLFNNAQSIITIGRHMAERIATYCTNPDKIKIVPNWVDSDHIRPIAKEDNWFAKKYNQVDKLTVVYSGNLGDTHDFQTLLKVAEKLKPNRDINILIIGDGAKGAFIKQTIEANKLDNVILLPLQDMSVFPYSVAAADVGIVTLNKGIGSVSVPSKSYSILAAGAAMLAMGPTDSELALIINNYTCGKIFENGDVNGVMEFILAMNKDKQLLQEYKLNSRIASQDFTPANAKQYYSYINGSSKFE